jgi:hypothetical protein
MACDDGDEGDGGSGDADDYEGIGDFCIYLWDCTVSGCSDAEDEMEEEFMADCSEEMAEVEEAIEEAGCEDEAVAFLTCFEQHKDDCSCEDDEGYTEACDAEEDAVVECADL